MNPFYSSPRNRRGTGLLIILAMVVLISALVVMFLSWALSQRQVAANSANQTKAEVFARGALDMVVSGFQQEIAAGSGTSTIYTVSGTTIYIPTSNNYAIPVQWILGKTVTLAAPSSITAQTTKMPTLIRESGRGDTASGATPIPTPGVASNASACNSTTTVSYNGRNISLPRWNAHYLLMRANSAGLAPSTTYDDRTPVTSIPVGSFNPANVQNNGGFMPPDWVYVTKEEGPVVLNTPNVDAGGNTVTAVGRYAYAVYDEGAILDMNAAGAPLLAGVPPAGDIPAGDSQPPLYATKGALAFADLTQLTAGTSSFTQAAINDFVAWRNYASMQNLSGGTVPTGSFPSYAFNAAVTNYYYNMIVPVSNVNGYMTTNTYTSGGRTDQAILSRQELISLMLGTNSTGTFNNFNPGLLMYLGTFSRAVNAPSYYPPLDASAAALGGSNGSPAIYAYNTNKEISTGAPFSSTSPNPNRDIPNVRFASAATIVHYNDSGSPILYAVQAGTPLIQRRFSLTKLAWVTFKGPSADVYAANADDPIILALEDAGVSVATIKGGTDANVQACFGLQWNSGSTTGTNPQPYYRWEYVGSTAAQTTPPTTLTSIETLDKVASESREPNYFELLKAGILNGSLGRDPGLGADLNIVPPNGGIGVYSGYYPTGGPSNFKSSPDLHLLQIGVNIIDQASPNSYPTAIHLEYWSSLSTEDEVAVNTVYGDKNLPGITALTAIIMADPMPSGASPNTVAGTLNGWLQPYLWNPHQVPTSSLNSTSGSAGTATGLYPSEFRAHAYGVAYTEYMQTSQGGHTVSNSGIYELSPKTNWDDGTGTDLSAGRGDVYFTNPADSTSPFYNAPTILNLSTTGALVDMGVNKTPLMNTYNYDTTTYHANDVASYGSSVTSVLFAGFSLAPNASYTADPTFPIYPSTPNNLTLKIEPDTVTPAYFSLQYLGPDGYYHPYNFWARVAQSYNSAGSKQWKTNDFQTVNGETQLVGWGPMKMDPRTDRFSASNCWWGPNSPTLTFNPGNGSYVSPSGGGYGGGGDYCIPYFASASPFTYIPTYNPNVGSTGGGSISLWQRNDSGATAGITVSGTLTNAYYSDPDGVVRYADGYRQYPTSGDGSEMYPGNATVTPGSTITTPNTTASPPGSAQARRPMILNRPYRSVGEMGFAYRDLPFKTVDLWTAKSGDAALLDLFSVSDQPTVVAGQVNINTAPIPVIKALLSGAAKSDALGVQMSAANTGTLVAALGTPDDGQPDFVSDIAGPLASFAGFGPYLNRANLVTRLGPLISDPYYNSGNRVFITSSNTSPNYASNWANKSYAEGPMRALVDVTNVRTWNLLIDLVAQTGVFAPNPPATSAALGTSFIVQGERHYWLHVAIDRYTGQIVDQKLESVYEQ